MTGSEWEEVRRAMFEPGAVILCVENTYIPARDGTTRTVERAGSTVAECRDEDGKPYRMEMPRRVSTVERLEGGAVRWPLDGRPNAPERLRGHTVTLRRVDAQPVDGLELFDEHEGGQLRLACAGEQVPLLPLPDAEIPTREPARVDEPPAPIVEPLEGQGELEGVRVVSAPFVGHLAAPEGVELEEGAAVEVKLAVYDASRVVLERWSDTEWVPGTVTGYRASTEGLERFRRVDVVLADGRRLAGCHPECVRPVDAGPDFAELHRQRLEGMTTRRERLERKAEKRRDWAESRARKAETTDAAARAKLDAIPFGQPVHGYRDANYREKARRGLDRAHDHRKMAQNHEQKAEGLESQLAGAVYSDDADAVERLEARIAELEAERDRIKRYNASCRKGARDVSILDDKQQAELASVARVCPYQIGDKGQAPAYWAQNIGGNITRNRKRLEGLKRDAVTVAGGGRGYGRPMTSRYAGEHGDHLGGFNPTDANFRRAREIAARLRPDPRFEDVVAREP